VRVALSRLGVGALHAVMVGDTIMDVLAAKAAGAKAIAVLCGHGDHDELRAAQPDALIQDLTELPTAVMRL
jgi:pyrophosphatase PpaX